MANSQLIFRNSACAAAMIAGIGIALAQAPAQQPGNNAPGQAQQAPQSGQSGNKGDLQAPADAAQNNERGRAGAEEPSSQVQTTEPQETAVFVNGSLVVPGAPKETQTTPAKFSQKNAADDELITVAHALKSISPEQRRAIYQALKGTAAGTAPAADVGDELPATVELKQVPAAVTAQAPGADGYEYVTSGNKVMLVSPPNRIVVGVLTE